MGNKKSVKRKKLPFTMWLNSIWTNNQELQKAYIAGKKFDKIESEKDKTNAKW